MRILKGLFKKVESFRNEQIDKREKRQRVEKALKGNGKTKVQASIERKAKALAKKTKLPYGDVLEYVEHEEKKKSRNEAIGSFFSGGAEIAERMKKVNETKKGRGGNMSGFIDVGNFPVRKMDTDMGGTFKFKGKRPKLGW